jgi:proteasome accessory factor C
VSGPRGAEERLRRLLVMLPWLMETGRVPLPEVATRFGLTESEVTRDLELVAMCGLPPYVDEMIDVFIDDGVVYVGVPRLFTRPLRLTAPEGFSLLTAARAAMELPGADPTGPLARGLEKLARALGDAGLDSTDDTAGVVVDLDRPELADELVAAVADGAELSIRHYSPSRDAVVARTIVPRHVFTDGDHWYVLADDDLSGERRTFRIDRLDAVERTGVVHAVDPDVTAPTSFFDDPSLPRAVVRLAPAARWVVDRYPVDHVTELDGRGGWVEVELPVTNVRWLARLLIRLGPDAELREPEEWAAAPRELAAKVLDAYAATDSRS